MREVARFFIGVLGIYVGLGLFGAIRSRLGGRDGE